MTVLHLVTIFLFYSPDHVFEVMTFVDNSVKYTRPNSIIDNWQVVQDIVRKSGYKFRVIGNPHLNAEIMDKDKDIIKR